jgi:hypothetical protein
MRRLASGVVRDLDVEGIPVFESEADAPSIVDRDGMLPFPAPGKPVTGQLVQPVSRRHPQIADAARKIDVLNPSPCALCDLRRQAAQSPRQIELLSVPVCDLSITSTA